MLASKMQRIAMSAATRNALAPLIFRTSTPAVHVMASRGFATDNQQQTHAFSSMAQNPRGTLERPLKVLDMNMVRKIKAELMEVDRNSDGRIDAEELKALLRRHSSAFTDEEIIEIGELFYASKGGESSSIESFIEAVDRAAALKLKKDDDGPEHFKEGARHPLGLGTCGVEFLHTTKSHHGHYTKDELEVNLTHVEPKDNRDKVALAAVKLMRNWFDLFTGWRNDNITVNNILNRTIYLETIAAVPGMVAAIVRHFRSLRSMKPDGGYMQLFLEEANNERMHLLTFVRMKDPNMLFRATVVLSQFGFGAAFLVAYSISPSFCHRFVGYVEEEACSTYTKIIKAIETAPEGSELAAWRTEPAPKIARAYWKLEQGTVLDMMYAVRADEAEHRDVNHLVSGVKEGQINPLYDPEAKLDTMLSRYVSDMMNRDRDATPKSV